MYSAQSIVTAYRGNCLLKLDSQSINFIIFLFTYLTDLMKNSLCIYEMTY